MARKKGEEAIAFAEENKDVIVVDELAEVESGDPTFGGMREGARLDEAHLQVIPLLRDQYEERFRHRPPADEILLFRELADEINIPGEESLMKLLLYAHRKERYSQEEQEEILAAAESFLKKHE